MNLKFDFDLPTDEDVKNSTKFDVYNNYIVSLSNEITKIAGEKLNYLAYVCCSDKFKALLSKRKNNIDLDTITRYLRNAWFTELQLNFTNHYINLAPYANHWACVQLYYAIYSAICAFNEADENSSPSSHKGVLNTINGKIKSISKLFPYPWHILCIGNPDNEESLDFIHESNEVNINHNINPLKQDASFLDRFCQFLKTTRQKEFKKRKEERRKELKKKKVSCNEADKLGNKMPPTSIFNCLYRLRCRANYTDADMFISTIEYEQSAIIFNQSLQKICYHTLAMLELLVLACVRENEYEKIVQDFVKKISDHKHPISKRKSLILDYITSSKPIMV